MKRMISGEVLTYDGLMESLKFMRSKSLKKHQENHDKALTVIFKERRQKLQEKLDRIEEEK